MSRCIICGAEIEELKGNSITPLDFAFSEREYIQMEKDGKLVCCDKCDQIHIVPIRNIIHACNMPWNDKAIFKESLVALTLMELQNVYKK